MKPIATVLSLIVACILALPPAETLAQEKAGTIVDADINSAAAISPTKIAGTAATLTTNTFYGKQSINNGSLALSSTLNAQSGLVSIGGLSFLHSYGIYDTFLGQEAGNFTMSGGGNTGVGTRSLFQNTTGAHNTGIGLAALWQNTVGYYNTATGSSALADNTTGYGNTSTGYFALANNTTGFNNTAMGSQAGYANTDGDGNTSIGSGALKANTTGSNNTVVGYRALESLTSGWGNTAIGYGAGSQSAAGFDGYNNTFIGNVTGAAAIDVNGSTAIGYGARVAKSDAIVLGMSSTFVGIGTQSPADKLDVVGNILIGDLVYKAGCVKQRSGNVIGGLCFSDERLKRNIEPFKPVLEKLVQIQPVHFDWRTDEYPDMALGSSRSSGLIAQDVEKVLPEMVAENSSGFKAVNYSQLPLMLLEAMREQQAQILELRSQLEKLKDEIRQAAKR